MFPAGEDAPAGAGVRAAFVALCGETQAGAGVRAAFVALCGETQVWARVSVAGGQLAGLTGHGTMTAMTSPALRVDKHGEPLRLLHVHAHPDDESSKGAATTAKYVAEGVEVVVATCTGGERGSILNPAMDRPDVLANIGEIRRQEMERARDILGIRQVWLGFVDSGLPEGDPLPPLPGDCFANADLDEAVDVDPAKLTPAGGALHGPTGPSGNGNVPGWSVTGSTSTRPDGGRHGAGPAGRGTLTG